MDQLWNGKKRKITIKERGTGVLKRQLVADDARDDGIFNHFYLHGMEIWAYDTRECYYTSEELPEEEYRHEAVEACPHCGYEHYEKDWSPRKGYRTRCMHCGESILLCDECLHADDNPERRCDWDENTGRCFRDGGAADG
mgnify:CR=1 FL=1